MHGDWGPPTSEASNVIVPVNSAVIDRIHRLKTVMESRCVTTTFWSGISSRPGVELGIGWVNWLVLRRSAKDALREAEVEVNLALKGAQRNPFKTGDIRQEDKPGKLTPTPPPLRRHRWECGECERRWLADAGFEPTICAETLQGFGAGEGCGSNNIGLAKEPAASWRLPHQNRIAR